jgi:hypothetical protein
MAEGGFCMTDVGVSRRAIVNASELVASVFHRLSGRTP